MQDAVSKDFSAEFIIYAEFCVLGQNLRFFALNPLSQKQHFELDLEIN